MADALPKGGSGAAVGVNQMAGDLGYLIAPVATLSLAGATSFSTAYIFAAIPAAAVFAFALLKLKQPPPATQEPEAAVEQPVEPVG
jgi:MFS family permease